MRREKPCGWFGFKTKRIEGEGEGEKNRKREKAKTWYHEAISASPLKGRSGKPPPTSRKKICPQSNKSNVINLSFSVAKGEGRGRHLGPKFCVAHALLLGIIDIQAGSEGARKTLLLSCRPSFKARKRGGRSSSADLIRGGSSLN